MKKKTTYITEYNIFRKRLPQTNYSILIILVKGN